MGGQPVLALNIAAWPEKVDIAILGEILIGAAEMVRTAGAVIAGGHTIRDEEPKFGLAVIGFAHPDQLLTKTASRPGDILYLTKPLGSGTITTAAKRQIVSDAAMAEAIGWMKKLNREAAEAGLLAKTRAATDITGFGLLGHASEIAVASGVSFELTLNRIPIMEHAYGYAADWVFPGGSISNFEAYNPLVAMDEGISKEDEMLLYDAQTSGGLLLSVPAENRAVFEEAMKASEASFWQIGKVIKRQKVAIHVRKSSEG